MSSGAGRFPHQYLWAYGIAKAGIIFLAKTAAEELGPLGIRVNAVAPGVIRTPLIEHILADESADHFGSIPAGRVGQPEEIAACITFLASDEASYCHGTVLVCDGGQLAING
jgi:meso-butanediol dehydrogenase / (S,S)-butanediol dehydrogenase / diacetyl reductase